MSGSVESRVNNVGTGGGGGSGTVTSIGVVTNSTTSSIIVNSSNNLTGSPVTTSGNITLALKTQSANLVLSGPTTGAAAAPTFRALVGADLPLPAVATLGGVFSKAAASTKFLTAISSVDGSVSNGQPAFTDISGAASTGQIPDLSATYSVIAGNASIATVGTVTTGTWSATTIALNKGGTGQTTKAPAFDALQPMTTSGDIIYGGASGTGTRLAKGSDTQVLTLASGLPSWATASASITYGVDLHWVSAANNYGSTATKIVKWSTVTSSVTTNGDITYASSSTNGDSWTINHAGLFSIFLALEPTASTIAQMGISLNASSLTTNYISLALTQQLGISSTQTNVEGGYGVVVYLAINDVIRVHTNGTTMATGATTGRQQFWIRRIV